MSPVLYYNSSRHCTATICSLNLKEKQMSPESKYSWAVAQRIDQVKRTIVVETGVIDTVGVFQPQSVQHLRNPDWLTMSECEFRQQAELAIEQNRQLSVEHAR